MSVPTNIAQIFLPINMDVLFGRLPAKSARSEAISSQDFMLIPPEDTPTLFQLFVLEMYMGALANGLDFHVCFSESNRSEKQIKVDPFRH